MDQTTYYILEDQQPVATDRKTWQKFQQFNYGTRNLVVKETTFGNTGGSIISEFLSPVQLPGERPKMYKTTFRAPLMAFTLKGPFVFDVNMVSKEVCFHESLESMERAHRDMRWEFYKTWN